MLLNKKCVPCQGGMPALTEKEAQKYLKELKTEWQIIDNKKIRQEFKFKSFREAIDFVNKMAELAENEDHHPDMMISYRRVIVELTTHAIGGLSENDFIVARKIEKLGAK